MAVTTIVSALAALRKLSKENGDVSLENTAGIVEGWEKIRTTEQLTKDERNLAAAAKPAIANLFAADPAAELDPHEVAERVGLPAKQGAWSFVRHQLKILRLTHQAKGNGHAAAAD